MSKFNPLDDRILIKKNPIPSKTIGGIIIPDTTNEKPQDGVVIEVGPGARNPKTGERIALSVNVGDTVIFGKNAGQEVTHDGEDYHVMFEKEIIARIS